MLRLSLVLLAALFGSPALFADARPNVVLLLADDLGYGELRCYGGKVIPTPNLDALAEGGVRFASGYVTAPFCAASRAGLFTGRYPTRFGFELNPIGADNDDPRIGLPVGERTIADELRDAGYITALIGKWHLGGTARFHPQRRGFDEFFGFLHEGHYFVPRPWDGVTTWLRRRALPDGSQGRWTSPDGRVIWSTHLGREPDYDANNPILRDGQPVDERDHLTDAFTREAERFIERHCHQPFFLCVSFNAVHSPMQGADRYMARFAHVDDAHRRIFAAMLAHLDDGVGRIMEKLRACGLEENTFIVFLSDNGGPTRELTSSNHPWRGEKGQLYEGGIRVPLLMRWKGRLRAGKVEDRAVSALDLAPTFLAAAKVTRRTSRRDVRHDGVNLLPFLTGENEAIPHKTLYWRAGLRAALRQGAWKIVRHRSRSDDRDVWEMYHLEQDPGESRDLAAHEPDKLQTLINVWEFLNREMIDPLW